jgi:hypothetical protein
MRSRRTPDSSQWFVGSRRIRAQVRAGLLVRVPRWRPGPPPSVHHPAVGSGGKASPTSRSRSTMAAACLLLRSQGTPGRAPRGHRPRGRISLRPTGTSHLFVVDDSAMPAAFVLLEVLPADSPGTDLLVTSHGSNSRPAPTGALATSLVWMSRAVTLEMLSDLHLAEGTAADRFGERQPADSTAKQKDMRLWMSVVSGARLRRSRWVVRIPREFAGGMPSSGRRRSPRWRHCSMRWKSAKGAPASVPPSLVQHLDRARNCLLIVDGLVDVLQPSAAQCSPWAGWTTSHRFRSAPIGPAKRLKSASWTQAGIPTSSLILEGGCWSGWACGSLSTRRSSSSGRCRREENRVLERLRTAEVIVERALTSPPA